MPGTLGLSVVEEAKREFAKRDVSASCTAAVVEFPNAGARIVTAKHCTGERLEVFDEEHSMAIDEHRDAIGDIDLALLETEAPLPFEALSIRESATLSRGERLCAFRITKNGAGLSRQRICGSFLRLAQREDLPPLILVRNPFPRGTSGSPLMDDEGKVVGIVVATQDEWGLAEPIEAAALLTGEPENPR